MRRMMALMLVALLGLSLSPLPAMAQSTPDESVLYDRPTLVIDPGMHTAMIWSASMDRNEEFLVTGSDDKTVRVWSVADGTLLRTIRVPAGPGNVGQIFAVAISPDGTTIAAGGWTGLNGLHPIYLFDRATGRLIRRLGGRPDVVNHLTFSPSHPMAPGWSPHWLEPTAS